MPALTRFAATAAAVAAAVALTAAPAFAIASIQENVRVGTSFTRQPHEIACFSSPGCPITWSHSFVTDCTKHADVRLRYQRDFLPDVTEREWPSFMGCSAQTYRSFSKSGHGHHQDARVLSGSAVMRFGAR